MPMPERLTEAGKFFERNTRIFVLARVVFRAGGQYALVAKIKAKLGTERES